MLVYKTKKKLTTMQKAAKIKEMKEKFGKDIEIKIVDNREEQEK